MPPNKNACELIAVSYKAKVEIINKLSQAKSAVLKAVSIRNALKYGINIADALGGELVAAIGSVATKVAATLLDTSSTIATNVMEGFLSKLLQILLAFPTAIFSLVAIPHEVAKDSVAAERRYLGLAQNNLFAILRIVTKWSGGFSGQRYYEQIRDSLEYINTAINLAAAMIKELDNPDNSFFDENKYKQLRSNLKRAIDITKPYSVIDEELQISSRIQQNKTRIYREKSISINNKYRNRRSEAAIRYSKNILELKVEGSGNNSAMNRVENAAKTQYVNILYQNELKDISNDRENELAIAESEAQLEATRLSSDIIKRANSIVGEFVNDMNTIQDQLFLLLDNTKNAYLRYKESQILCANIFGIRNIISNIISSLISLIRTSSNVAGSTLSVAIESAQGMMEEVRDDFEDDERRYVASDSGISATELSLDVTLGNGALRVADQFLESAVTDSLIALINSDDVLQTADDEFDEFLGKLEKIPDWDGQLGVWAVNISESATAPYTQMIADSTEALAKIPALSVSGNESDKKRIAALMSGVNNSFKTLRRHNSYVNGVLSSYTPYMASEAGDIKSILASAGLLRGFALAMSVPNLAADILSSTKGELGDEFPNYERCKQSYPDLFSDLDLATSAALNEYNMPAEQESLLFQESLENKELERIGTKKALDSVNLGRSSAPENKDLAGFEESQSGDLSSSTG